MDDVQPNARRVATVSAVLFAAIFSLILVLVGGTSVETMLAGLARAGFAFTLIGLFWGFYDRRGWRYRWLRLGGWLSDVPDLNGRWVGTVRRQDEQEEHPFVVEITQTYTSLRYRTYSTNSRGQSETAVIQRSGDAFSVVSTWHTTTRRRDDATADDMFQGCSCWTLSFADERPRIEDNYFTRREPPTKGRVEVHFESKQRKQHL